jgi:hypothetical protein
MELSNILAKINNALINKKLYMAIQEKDGEICRRIPRIGSICPTSADEASEGIFSFVWRSASNLKSSYHLGIS